jgi:isocitrate/isopropylmalate dehydrogenase
MNTGLLLAKSENPKERSVARIISIQFIPAKKGKEKETTLIHKETILFYTKPIFRAKKYEFF